VGTWLLDTNTDVPDNSPTLASFSTDGIYTQAEADASVGIGSWQATGPSRAELTFHQIFTEEGDTFSRTTVRAQIEVAADGQSLTATYTLEFTLPGGMSTGQYGPGNVSGTKLVVEPMGTPVGTFEDLFSQFEEGAPEATPE
jgi:hypothetical protein